MGLQVWLPLNGNLNNQGLDGVIVTATNIEWQTNGKIGQCIRLGTIDKFTIPSMVGAKQMSFAYWVRVNTATSTNWLDSITWYSTDGTAVATSRQEFYTDSTCTSVWYKGGSMDRFSENVVGEWNHYVFTIDYEKGEANYYINGKKHGTTHTNVDTTHYLRGDFSFGQNGLDLSENDIRIYDHALSPLEVKHLAQGLVLHYPLAMPGQENLVKQSNQFNVGSHAAKLTPSVLADGTYQVIAESGNSNYTSSWWMTIDGIEDSFTEGETFTISFTIKSSDANTTTPPKIYVKSGMGYYSMKGKVTDAWSTVYYTGTWKKENSLAPHLGWSGLVGTYHIMNWKIERGSRPTPWLPNPADAKYSALGFNDDIEYDVSGYGNNGTKMGTITYDADTPRYETSAVFNGSSDIRSAKSSFGWFDFKEGTVAAWFKPANTTQTWASVGVQNDSGAGSRSFSICNYSGKAATVVGYDSSWGNQSSDCSMAANTWYHLCATITNGDTVKLYVNGELVQTRTVTNTTGKISSNTQFAVGVDLPGSDERFTGQLSDVRFYTTCLNESDVRDLYAVGASLSDTGVLFSNEVSEV